MNKNISLPFVKALIQERMINEIEEYHVVKGNIIIWTWKGITFAASYNDCRFNVVSNDYSCAQKFSELLNRRVSCQ